MYSDDTKPCTVFTEKQLVSKHTHILCSEFI